MDIKDDKHLIIITFLIVLGFIGSIPFIFSDFKNHSTSSSSADNIKKVSFVGVGDNLIHDTIYKPADYKEGIYGDGKYNFNYLYENIKSEINKYDLKYINQESIVAGDDFGISTYPKFNTPEDIIPALKKAGFNIINMANNHSLDMGENRIINTIKIWNNTNLYHVGLYNSEIDRNTPYIIEKNGIKIALLSYTYGTNGMLPSKNYMVPYLNEENIVKDVKKAKSMADFILVSVHWGEENIEDIDGYQKKYSALFNELGVDVVLGTHAHRIQKAEWLKNKNGKKTLIYYGTGNFVHNMLTSKTYLEGMASWTFVKNGEKKYIDNPKFTPLVFHLERGPYGYEGSVYRLDKYPMELANKHIEMWGNGKYHINMYKQTVEKLIPKEMIDMKIVQEN